jgi:hypothetical protein
LLFRHGPSRLFLFERYGDVGIGRQANLLSFNPGHKTNLDVVMVPFVSAFALLLFELDPVALDAIDHADMNAVGADDFHILFDLVPHGEFLLHWVDA